MPMCSLSFEVETDADFQFDGLPMVWQSGRVSGSFHASSSLGSHMPTSSRSTPPFSASFDFSSSFPSSNDTVPFYLNPPSCATSNYFPMTPETGHVSGLDYPVFLATPSRSQFDNQTHPFTECAAQLVPSQAMDFSFAINRLDPHPHSTRPAVLAQYDHVPDPVSNWRYLDSPIRSKLHSPKSVDGPSRSIKTEPQKEIESPTTPSIRANTQALMDGVRHRAIVLQQQMQQCSSLKKPAWTTKGKRRRTVVMGDDSFALDSVELASSFKCPIKDCGKVYRRIRFSCDWCKHTTNRWDNLKAHIRLHGTQREYPRTKPRVHFAAGAVLQYEEIMRNEGRRGHGAENQKRPNPDS
ncbi:hypothetical protein C7999DRAFT_40217 [Corynascus novoguineensis]|uniref:C2H2-type domain-containing protein n=1 Tax=Corynascus novoguineensis TaxID=1126955 RepID=A0AAN7CUG8_9PEZI|nr:hypothetical protein C7999DRAFT_40217 [Corynascus novoguineensis]